MATRVILPGVLEITTTMGDNRLALYLLHDQLTLLVDSGLHNDPERVIFPALLAAGFSDQVDLLLISHADADHHGGNGAILTRSPGTKILCHKLDMARVCSRERHLRERYRDAVAADDTPFAPELLDWLEANIGPDAPVHIGLVGGEEINLGPGQSWLVIHAPGHTDGHLALWNERAQLLIIQDALFGVGVPTATGELASPPPYFAVDAYLSTITKLRALGATQILTAHYPPIEGQDAVEQFFVQSEQFVHTLDALVLEVVRRRKRAWTLSEICGVVDQQLGPFAVAVQWVPPVRAHLERHVAQGKLREVRTHGAPRAWVAAG
jgi:glyoxylase-like metal-dependent hydrolase (beta-lactamase superfamily II)